LTRSTVERVAFYQSQTQAQGNPPAAIPRTFVFPNGISLTQLAENTLPPGATQQERDAQMKKLLKLVKWNDTRWLGKVFSIRRVHRLRAGTILYLAAKDPQLLNRFLQVIGMLPPSQLRESFLKFLRHP
jgi:hypothetical protein